MDSSVGLTVVMVLVAWPAAALLLGLLLGRAISACGSHDAAFPEPTPGFGPSLEPAPQLIRAQRDAV